MRENNERSSVVCKRKKLVIMFNRLRCAKSLNFGLNCSRYHALS